jgi:penicillin-binding protein 2
MALMVATFGNGGHLHAPHLLKGDAGNSEQIPLDPRTVQLVRDGLRGVVNDPNGTAKSARSDLVLVGGKTGTAQVASKKTAGVGERFMDHAWFVAVAPVQDPEIAVAVFVEHGGGGGAVAAPIAKKAIEGYFRNKAAMAQPSETH